MKTTSIGLILIIILFGILASCAYMILMMINITNININTNIVNNTNKVENNNDIRCGHCYCGEISVLKTKEIFFEALKERNVTFIENEILKDVIEKSDGLNFNDFSLENINFGNNDKEDKQESARK